MNSRLEYLYRSTSNFKEWGKVVFAGAPDDELARRLEESLESHEFFIADQVRLPELFFDDGLHRETDRRWHELSGLEATTEEPTDELARTIAAFVEECEAASRAGWQISDPMSREPR